MGNRTDKKTSHAPNEGESTESSEDEGNSTIQSPLPQRQRKQARALGTIGSKGSRDREHSVRQTSDSDVPVSSNKSKTKTKALGTIGGKKSRGSKVDEPLARGRSKTTESEEPTRKTPNPQPDDEPTASEEEEDIVSRPSKQHRSQQSDDEDTDRPVTPKKKDTAKARVGGLGQIGGKKRKETVEERNSNQDAEASRNRAESPPSTPNPAKRPNKLGMIGGGKLKRTEATSQSQTDKRPIAEEEDISTADEMPAQGERAQTEALNRVKESTRSASPPPKPQVRPRSLQKEGSKPAKEETPEERANRRREELRRELEAKSGPAKKKRRF